MTTQTITWNRDTDSENDLYAILDLVEDGDHLVAVFNDTPLLTISGEACVERQAIRVGANTVCDDQGDIAYNLHELTATITHHEPESAWHIAEVVMDANGNVVRRRGGNWYLLHMDESTLYDPSLLVEPVRVLKGADGRARR